MTRISRGFIDLDDAQIHYRKASPPSGSDSNPPLILIHASPASAKGLEPLMRAMATDRVVYAADTLGNGDSTGAIPEDAEIEFFADIHLAAMKHLGIEQCDLYGTHTGGSIATAIALKNPKMVRRLILDGIGLYDPDFQAELIERYAPAIKLDYQGMYLAWVWHFVRDTMMFWPWYRLDAAHRRSIGMPPVRVLHDKVLDTLKAVETYHYPYRAAIRYDKRRALPMLAVPTLAACGKEDMLFRYLDETAQLVPGSIKAVLPGSATPQALTETAERLRHFLNTGH